MTNMIRFAPRDSKRLQNEFDRLVDSFFPVVDTQTTTSVWNPRVDLSETDEAYLIEVDVPGLNKEDINISVHEGTLTISGERHLERKKEGTEYVRVERSAGNFYRSFTLPKAVDKSKIDAEYENGVLHMTVPKSEESKPQRIDIR